MGRMDGARVVKLASLSRVSHLASMRARWQRALDTRPDLRVHDLISGNVADDEMIEAIKPALQAELNRRIEVIDAELIELGMSID